MNTSCVMPPYLIPRGFVEPVNECLRGVDAITCMTTLLTTWLLAAALAALLWCAARAGASAAQGARVEGAERPRREDVAPAGEGRGAGSGSPAFSASRSAIDALDAVCRRAASAAPLDAAELARALRCLDRPAAASDATWTHVKSAGGLELYEYSAHGAHAVKCDALFDVEAHALLSCVRELELMPRWNPYVTHCYAELEPAEERVRACAALWTPPPMPRVRARLDARLDDALDAHGCMLITAGPPPRVPEASLAPEARGLLELPMRVVAALYPRAARQTRAVLVCAVPASIIPGWVVRLVLFVIAPVIYRASCRLLGAAVAEGQPLRARIEGGPHAALYARVRRACAAHVAAGAPGDARAAAEPRRAAANGAGWGDL